MRLHLARVEAALDSGFISARMVNGHYWRARRNGKTKTWKTRPGEFRIPIKVGFRTHGYITHASDFGRDFIIRNRPLYTTGA